MRNVLSGLFAVLMILSSGHANVVLPADGRFDIWPSIPFVRGADLCKFNDAYGQTRTEYMNNMIINARGLMEARAKGPEALQMLVAFNSLYSQNQALATQYQYLDVTLESTFKSYIDGYYRDLRPLNRRLGFKYVDDLQNVVNAAKNGQRDGAFNETLLQKLDFIAYGTYAFGPECRGEIVVTLHLIGRDGMSESFQAVGKPQFVMSTIASDIFTKFQRTQFPSIIKIGKKNLKLIGGLNGAVDTTDSLQLAEEACSTFDARLPNRLELELLDGYGDWSGGININNKVWAIADGKVYSPFLKPYPVRNPSEVNEKSFLYYCVK